MHATLETTWTKYAPGSWVQPYPPRVFTTTLSKDDERAARAILVAHRYRDGDAAIFWIVGAVLLVLFGIWMPLALTPSNVFAQKPELLRSLLAILVPASFVGVAFAVRTVLRAAARVSIAPPEQAVITRVNHLGLKVTAREQQDTIEWTEVKDVLLGTDLLLVVLAGNGVKPVTAHVLRREDLGQAEEDRFFEFALAKIESLKPLRRTDALIP